MVSENGDAPDKKCTPPAERFPLDEEDLAAIADVAELIQGRTSSMSPAELRGAATVLLALKRLPHATPGVQVSLEFSTPDADGNRAWADLEICAEEFRLDLGQHFYDPSVGGDTESRTVFETQSGTDWKEGEIHDWLLSAQAIAGFGHITLDDQSNHDAVDSIFEEEEE